jgi:hypothetical protein
MPKTESSQSAIRHNGRIVASSGKGSPTPQYQNDPCDFVLCSSLSPQMNVCESEVVYIKDYRVTEERLIAKTKKTLEVLEALKSPDTR